MMPSPAVGRHMVREPKYLALGMSGPRHEPKLADFPEADVPPPTLVSHAS